MRNPRVSFLALIGLMLLFTVGRILVETLWRGIVPSAPSIEITVAFSIVYALIYVAPLVLWIRDACINDGRFRRAMLPASPLVIFSYGALGGWLILGHGTKMASFGSAAAAGILFGLLAAAFAKAVDRIRVLDVATGLATSIAAYLTLQHFNSIFIRRIHNADDCTTSAKAAGGICSRSFRSQV